MVFVRICWLVLVSSALGILSIGSGCRKDGPPIKTEPVKIPLGSDGVFVSNEGNFMFGNASISYYAEGMEEAIEDLFKPANNRPLGDVCQSMYVFNNRFYIVVNNSGKIEVVHPITFAAIATFTGFNSPRYIQPVSNAKAYVTDLYAQAISIVNLASGNLTGSIPCPGWTEELRLVYGKVFVTNRSRPFLYVINTQQDGVVDSIPVGYGAHSIVEDKNGKLWVLCSGHSDSGQKASLHRIDPVHHWVESTLEFPSLNDAPWRLDINGTLDTLYFLNGDVYRISITETTLPSIPFIQAQGRNFYGLGIHPRKGFVYVADALDYIQRGKVYVYRPDGSLHTSFLAGIIPGDFYFFP